LCLTNYDLDGEEALNENDLQIKITGVIIWKLKQSVLE
jgi:hypothetical protein